MEGRVEILPEKTKSYSAIVVFFPNYEKVQVYPGTKRFVYENGNIFESGKICSVRRRVGERLVLESDGAGRYKSFFDVFKIKIRA